MHRNIAVRSRLGHREDWQQSTKKPLKNTHQICIQRFIHKRYKLFI